MTQPTANQQIEALKAQLLEAYVQKEQADEKIKAIRNVLAGIGLGSQVAQEAAPVRTDPAQ